MHAPQTIEKNSQLKAERSRSLTVFAESGRTIDEADATRTTPLSARNIVLGSSKFSMRLPCFREVRAELEKRRAGY